MKIFTNCPVCQDPLLNKLEGSFIDKTCTNKLNHKFGLSANNISLINFSLEIFPGTVLVWYFGKQNLYCYNCLFEKRFQSSSNTQLKLPFFEPDFSNYPKLIKKIKAYILLS